MYKTVMTIYLSIPPAAKVQNICIQPEQVGETPKCLAKSAHD